MPDKEIPSGIESKSDSWDSRVNEIFLQATEIIDPSDRHEYLAQACGNDVQFTAQGRLDVAADAEATDFFDQPGGIVDAVASLATREGSSLRAAEGTKIGRYKLLQRIGEGGFGVVYMAEQEEPFAVR